MTPGKRLIYSNSAVSADIGSPSRRHPTIIRWLHEGIAKATRRRVAFLDHRAASCILRVAFLDHRAASCILRVAFGRRTIPNGTDYHTKLTRYYKNHSRCTPDALPMHSRWPYEGQNGHTNSTRYWTIGSSFGNSLACQRFCHRSRSCCRSLKISPDGHTMAQDGLPNAPMSTRSEPNLKISTIVCPSGLNIGNVWRLH